MVGNVPYDPAGVKDAPFDPNNTRATPNSFGANVGAAMTQAGQDVTQTAQGYQSLLNESAANHAEVAYTKEVSDLKANYMQLEGAAAAVARPDFEKAIADKAAQYRAMLPAPAVRQFDANTIRFQENTTADASRYAAEQVKKSNLNSHNAIADMAIAKMGDINNIQNTDRFDSAGGDITHSINSVADINGLASFSTGVDSRGKLVFGDSPDAQAAKAQYEDMWGKKQGERYLTAAKTINDNYGPAASADFVQKHWDEIPDVAKPIINQYIAPKLKNQAVGDIVNNTMTQAEQSYQKAVFSTGGAIAPLVTIRENEGYTGKIGRDSNGANVLNGINEKAFPTQYAEAKKLLDTKGKAAADAYADSFYQKEIIDKNNIASLPANTQAIVADGLVNHGAGTFGQSLVAAAKNGTSPQQLIDMRRSEYQRLAASDTDGSKGYADSLRGWNNRLDKLQQQVSSQGAQQPVSKEDFYKKNEEEWVESARQDHLNKYPGDEYGAFNTANRMRAQINREISMEGRKVDSAVDAVTKAVSAGFGDGRVPTSPQELTLFHPELKDSIDLIEQSRPKVLAGLQKQMAANVSEERKKGYGAGLLPILNRITSDDPVDGIQTPKQLLEAYGSKNDLFLNGYKQSVSLLQQAQTPEGKAKLANQTQFLNDLNSVIDGSDEQEKQKNFDKAAQLFFGTGNDSKMSLDPSDKDSFVARNNIKVMPPSKMLSQKIDKSAQTIGDMMDIYIKATNEAAAGNINQLTLTPEEKIMADFTDGKITEADKNAKLKGLGINVGGARVPKAE